MGDSHGEGSQGEHDVTSPPFPEAPSVAIRLPPDSEPELQGGETLGVPRTGNGRLDLVSTGNGAPLWAVVRRAVQADLAAKRQTLTGVLALCFEPEDLGFGLSLYLLLVVLVRELCVS